jgi:hypothetical protein
VLGLRFIANHFNVMAIRTNHISGVVVCMVVRPQPRRAVVFSTRSKRRAVERINLLAILGFERDMKMCRLLLRLE